MKKINIFCLCLLVAVAGMARTSKGLSREASETVAAQIYQQWLGEQRAALAHNVSDLRIVQNDVVMPIHIQVFGDEPADGRSLWISMHGGGGTTQEVNDGQWRNQTVLYTPTEGVYVCPRAPWNAWNMWFQEPIDSVFEELILTLVATHHVNPDKVYVMGYSAGGDGVWRLAPRMADHWAAAAMMAGHPGDVGLVNLRNMPFSIWVGGADAAYDRNKEVAQRCLLMDSLQRQDPEGYVHENHILAGMPHWMSRRDTAAVSWMQQYERRPHPATVVWRQEEVLKRAFYWLEVPEAEMQRGKEVRATIRGNRIYLDRCDYSHLTLWLDDDMVDLDRRVTVYYRGRKIVSTRPERSEANLRESLASRRDRGYMFPAKVEVSL